MGADNGLLRFWSYVIGALKTIKPDLHQDLPGFIGQASIKPDGSQLTPLINQIAEIPHHFSLVLDDFHEIRTESIHQTLAYLIEHMPDRMHLVITSRSATRLPISRPRVRDQLVAITYPDALTRSFDLISAGAFLPAAAFLGCMAFINFKARQTLLASWICLPTVGFALIGLASFGLGPLLGLIGSVLLIAFGFWLLYSGIAMSLHTAFRVKVLPY